MGVRIQELPETTGINKEDVLIVEDGQGTKKGTVQQLDEALGVSQLKEDISNEDILIDLPPLHENIDFNNANGNLDSKNIVSTHVNVFAYVGDGYIEVKMPSDYRWKVGFSDTKKYSKVLVSDGYISNTKITSKKKYARIGFCRVDEQGNRLTLTADDVRNNVVIKRSTIINKLKYEIEYHGDSEKNILYFSADGDDKNDGTSPRYSKKSFQKYTNVPNITLMLKSGDYFSNPEMFSIADGSSIDIYGGTKKAVIDGSVKLGQLTLYDAEKGIYSTHISDNDLGFLIIDDVYNWNKKSSFEELSSKGDWFIDNTTMELYIKEESNIISSNIYYSANRIAFRISGNNTKISNLEIKHFSHHGIECVNSELSNVVISDNYIHHIGGSYHVGNVRYGNGIEVYLCNATDIYINHNRVSHCYDAGITPQDYSELESVSVSDGVYVENNDISHCAYLIEYFNRNKNHTAKNIIIKNNYLHDCRDITGVRPNQAMIGQIVLWSSKGAEDSIYVVDNIGIHSQRYAISFDSNDTKSKYIFDNNKLLVESESPIANVQNYSGSLDDIIKISEDLTLEDRINISFYNSKAIEKCLLN